MARSRGATSRQWMPPSLRMATNAVKFSPTAQRVHAEREAPDHAALEQLLHPFVHGRGGQAHLGTDVGVRTPAIGTHGRNNSGIHVVCLNICLHRYVLVKIPKTANRVSINFR
jgi:hypothetical protein